ncbi:cell division control protein 6 homolog [Syngnathoides biaculeatus]|uniref:cell division control protein 6 homolog n=1 Tax=Syngnathoides biaculeatus TaxID=300417 RepID=UPI002ADD88BD|nr:cell division control protein 6 homolog [Syngnathoides biaculeatus]
MPSTRSQGLTQTTLPFPRRKSARVAPKPKRILSENSEPVKTNPDRLLPQSPGGADAAPLPRLPLSPRKRTGPENALNMDAALSASPPKQSKASARMAKSSPRRLAFDENSPVPDRRNPAQSSPAAASSPRRRESGSPARPSPDGDSAAALCRHVAQKGSSASVKQALHTAVPERLLSREAERAAIRTFLEENAVRRRPGSLYISGAPGTGKTACLNCVLRDMKEELSQVQTLVVNCMSLRSSRGIFPLLANRLRVPDGRKGLQRHLTGPGPALLLVLDELDQLDSKAQDVLYTIFEWPHLPKSRLCLVGIANALDLTDRILPRLQARAQCRPLLLNFPPYSREQLGAIVQDRLAQACAGGILDAAAVQFCARKVSAVSGDARKALDICRRAVEMVESEHRKKADHHTATESSMVAGVPQVARVLSEVYGDRMASGAGDGGESFPLQQKLLVCCLLMLVRDGKSKEVLLGKLHEVHSRLCSQRRVGGVSQSECLSLCSLLESRGVFGLKKAKEARLTKVFLKIEEQAVENALKDRTLVGSILAAGLP